MKSCAITDHGSMYGAVDFYKTMTKANIKPIIGYESYTSVPEEYGLAILAAGAEDRDIKNHHLVLLAMNNEGYRNLMQLTSYENIEGFVRGGRFAKGNLDLTYVKENNLGKGIICLTACLGGTVSKLVRFGLDDLAVQFVEELNNTFDEVYIEVQDNTTDDQEFVNKKLIELSNKTGLPLVLTKDAHYLNQEDWEAHDALLAMQVNKQIDDPDRWKFPGGPEYYVSTPDEMRNYLSNRGHYIPESAYNNTQVIADKCDIVLFDREEANGVVTKGYYGDSLFPDFPDIPEGFDQNTYLRKLAIDGLIEFISTRPAGYAMDVNEYIERLNYELDIIISTGYCGYFLILWDMMNYCKNYRDAERPDGIGLGPGRGSGVGSLVCRTLDITKIDPIKYGLIFERFLNPERKSIPDVDSDIADTDRHLVIQYLKDKYGEDRVSQIITYQQVKVGGGTRDLMRLKGFDKKQQDEVCNNIPAALPDQSGADLATLMDIVANPQDYTERFADKHGQAVRIAQEFKGAIETQPWVLQQMEKLEGCTRALSIHAGGVLVFPDSSHLFAPHNKASGSAIAPVCQYDMDVIEDIGALKLDILGLITTRIIAKTSEKVRKQIPGFDIERIDYDDPKVFEMLRNGFTTDVFQFSGGGMTKALMDSNVNHIEDMIGIVALYRPGPLEAIDPDTNQTIYDTYISCCQSGQKYVIDEMIDGLFDDSKGLPIYQESIMKFVMHVGGCTYGYADIVRRATAKKDAKLMKEVGKDFIYGKTDKNGVVIIKGAINNGYSLEQAERYWEIIKRYSGYSFNKSHATAYAVAAYHTAWLKLYYPAYFLAEVMTSKDKAVDIATSMKEAKRLGVPILPPSVNNSDTGFTIEALDDGRHAIRFGIGAIKGIANAEAIVTERPFATIEDFFERVDGRKINKGKAASLILAGGFDEFEPNRHEVWNKYHKDIRKFKVVTEEEMKAKPKDSFVPKIVSKFSDDHRFKYEQELMGVFVSSHPLDDFPYKPWVHIRNNENVEVVGIVIKPTVRQTKAKTAFAFFKLETLEDMRDCVIWPNQFSKYSDRLEDGAIVVIRGRKDGERDQLVVNEILVRTSTFKKGAEKRVVAPIPTMPTDILNPFGALENTDTLDDIMRVKAEEGKSLGPDVSDMADLFAYC